MQQARSTQSTEALGKAFISLDNAMEFIDELWEAGFTEATSQMDPHEVALVARARVQLIGVRTHLQRHATELGCPEVVTPDDDGLQLVGGDAA